MSKSIWILVLPSFVASLASAETIFKCAGKDGTDMYQNFPCPPELESRVSARTSGHPSTPGPSGNPLTAQPTPPAPSPVGNSSAAPQISTVPVATGYLLPGMSTKEVRAVLGEPIEVTQEEVVQGRVETWSYGASSIQFDHTGRLSGTQP
jgi:hypothetical protein